MPRMPALAAGAAAVAIAVVSAATTARGGRHGLAVDGVVQQQGVFQQHTRCVSQLYSVLRQHGVLPSAAWLGPPPRPLLRAELNVAQLHLTRAPQARAASGGAQARAPSRLMPREFDGTGWPSDVALDKGSHMVGSAAVLPLVCRARLLWRLYGRRVFCRDSPAVTWPLFFNAAGQPRPAALITGAPHLCCH